MITSRAATVRASTLLTSSQEPTARTQPMPQPLFVTQTLGSLPRTSTTTCLTISPMAQTSAVQSASKSTGGICSDKLVLSQIARCDESVLFDNAALIGFVSQNRLSRLWPAHRSEPEFSAIVRAAPELALVAVRANNLRSDRSPLSVPIHIR